MSTSEATWRGCLCVLCSVPFLSGLLSFSGPPAPATLSVEISQMKYIPAILLANKGDTIIFTNRDIVTHDVTSASGKPWKSPALAPGDSWRMVATQDAAFFCSFHPVMKGSIRLSQP